MSVYWPLGGIGWVEIRLTLGSILKLLVVVVGGNFLFLWSFSPIKWNKSRWLIK